MIDASPSYIYNKDVPARMEAELTIFKQRLVSPEAKEAFSAFAEKRKPDFSKFY